MPDNNEPTELTPDQQASVNEIAEQCVAIITAALMHTTTLHVVAPLFLHMQADAALGSHFLTGLLKNLKSAFTTGQSGFLYRQHLASYLMTLEVKMHRELTKQLEAQMATGGEVEKMKLQADFIQIIGIAAKELERSVICQVDDIHNMWMQHKGDVELQSALAKEACEKCDHKEECNKDHKRQLN